jgi:oligopeptidase B
MLEPARAIEDQLFAEMRARVADADVSAPVLEDGYWYYEREEPGKQYSIYARRKGSMTAPEEVLLDGNLLATGHEFYAIGDYAVSRDGTLLAWTDDVVGRNQFTLHVKNLTTGALLPDFAADIASSLVWANDNATLFYVGKDPTTLREDRVFRHRLGGSQELVYQEADGAYYVDVAATKSRRYVAIHLDATTTS